MRSGWHTSLLLLLCAYLGAAESAGFCAGERRLNNLVTQLMEASSISATQSFAFSRSSDGWIIVLAACKGAGRAVFKVDNRVLLEVQSPAAGATNEAMRFVTKGS